TAHAEILVETVEEKLAVPVQAIYAKGGKRYVFRRIGERVEPVAVNVGSIGSEWAEVAAGVEKGERVLLAFGEDYRRMIPDAPLDERPGGGAMRRGGGPARQSSAASTVGPDAKLPGTDKPESASEGAADEKPASKSAESSEAKPAPAEVPGSKTKTDKAGGSSVGKAP
ncbi:MAG: hypothetical protein Q7R41_07165, partial [Phycisphaerales bacterium]|nr:hypothetical protein [Phycisphaerales bacterium]